MLLLLFFFFYWCFLNQFLFLSFLVLFRSQLNCCCFSIILLSCFPLIVTILLDAILSFKWKNNPLFFHNRFTLRTYLSLHSKIWFYLLIGSFFIILTFSSIISILSRRIFKLSSSFFSLLTDVFEMINSSWSCFRYVSLIPALLPNIFNQKLIIWIVIAIVDIWIRLIILMITWACINSLIKIIGHCSWRSKISRTLMNSFQRRLFYLW